MGIDLLKSTTLQHIAENPPVCLDSMAVVLGLIKARKRATLANRAHRVHNRRKLDWQLREKSLGEQKFAINRANAALRYMDWRDRLKKLAIKARTNTQPIPEAA